MSDASTISDSHDEAEIPGLPDGSVLYISVVTHPDHPLHAINRAHLHPAPDFDVGTYVQRIGPWIRRYFAPHIIDGTTSSPPADLTPYRGVVIGCSLHYFSDYRTQLAPWQLELIAFLRRVIFEARLPFYGVCGGAYLGHLALGGRLVPNVKGPGIDPEAEGSIIFRTTEITLTDDGRVDPLFRSAPPSFGMHHLHSDYIAELAPGCRALAHSADIPNQAIAFGDRVRLLPGAHPELSDAFLRKSSPAFINTGQFGTDPTKSTEMMSVLSHLAPTPYTNQHLLPNFLRYFCAQVAA
jgi:GMP synthase-like glutamine amidotransferase